MPDRWGSDDDPLAARAQLSAAMTDPALQLAPPAGLATTVRRRARRRRARHAAGGAVAGLTAAVAAAVVVPPVLRSGSPPNPPAAAAAVPAVHVALAGGASTWFDHGSWCLLAAGAARPSCRTVPGGGSGLLAVRPRMRWARTGTQVIGLTSADTVRVEVLTLARGVRVADLVGAAQHLPYRVYVYDVGADDAVVSTTAFGVGGRLSTCHSCITLE